jgi:hypothetical protein
MIGATREIGLQKEPLDFGSDFRTHVAMVQAEKSFVQSNDRQTS